MKVAIPQKGKIHILPMEPAFRKTWLEFYLFLREEFLKACAIPKDYLTVDTEDK